jgi:methylglutaconyl-CoA hydratase
MSDAPTLLIDSSDAQITRLTLNRPAKRNALNIATLTALTQAVTAAAADLNRRVVILAGAGPIFCSGLDLAEAADPNQTHASAQALRDAYFAIASSPLITIAAVQGGALGGGVGLVAACDLAVAEEDVQIAFPEVRRGIIAAVVTALLRRQLGDRSARELILLGQSIDAARAATLGIINRIAPKGFALARAESLAQEALLAAPGSVMRTKKLLDKLAPRPLEQDLAIALEMHLSARNSPEFAEGLNAFKEKRPPKWGPRPAN